MQSLKRRNRYFQQDISWEEKTGNGDDGKPTYAAAVTIKGRKIKVQKLVKSPSGREVVSDTTIETSADVSAGDRLDGREVIAETDRVKLSGDVAYKGVML